MTTQEQGASSANPDQPELIHKIASVTRMLREGMRELGLDQAVSQAADAIPDARERLDYVARMTEQAANRVLNAAEEVQPLQEEMQHMAETLDQRWQQWFENPVELSEARQLVDDTRLLLKTVPEKAKLSQEKLLEIIMAQDFQDLTGQVITRMLGVINSIETELIQVLITYLPEETREAKRKEIDTLVNGPQVKPEGKSEVVSSQDQVDDLLSSLGF